MKIKVGIFGGSGYGGSELLRILLFHSQVELVLTTANEHAGKRVEKVHPNLSRITDLVFQTTPSGDEIRNPKSEIRNLDCVFLALPHGQSMELVPHIPKNVKVIDLAGDFRLLDLGVFQQYYGRAHTAPQLVRDFVYGLTEINREPIASATRVANPGCFATAIGLGLYPLVKSGLIVGKVIADAKTGSSGSGAKPAENTHHPKRSNSFFAYKPFTHQHLPEITQTLAETNPEWSGELWMQVHSAPVVRGIFASLYATMRKPTSDAEIGELFEHHYAESFFVRLTGPGTSPDINWVKHTNFADIGWATSGTNLVVFVAIDNLVKGAAGQAVQNMNLMFGLDETTGLRLPGSNP
jgi:N-acetyl-gamma-glutamyl-phosphate reductase